MPLKQIRERQKIIVWVTAIILIPIFALTFGLPNMPTGGDRPLLDVDGTVYTQREVQAFLHRLRVVQEINIPFNPTGIRQAGMLLLQIQAARKADVDVSKAEIGTYIRERFEQMIDPDTGKFDQKRFRQHLRSTLRTDSLDYQKGIEEILLLQKFTALLDDTALSSPFEAYVLWAQRESEVTYDLAEVKVADYRQGAQESVEDMDAAIKAYVLAHEGERSFLTPGKWNLEYIMVPYDAISIDEPTEEELKQNFEENKDNYAGKSFDDVRDEIALAVNRAKREASARFLVNSEVDSTIARLTASGTVTAQAVIESNPVLRVRSENNQIQIGTTGEENLTPKGINQHPVLGNSQALVDMLKEINNVEGDESRQERIDKLSSNFNVRVNNRNFSNEVGVFKIRVLSYVPGEPRDVEKDTAFRSEIEALIIDSKAEELARTAIDSLRQQVLDGTLPDGKLKTETKPLATMRELADAQVPLDVPTEIGRVVDGFHFYLPWTRSIPTYAQFQAAEEDVRSRYQRQAIFTMRRLYRTGERQNMWNMANWDKVKVLLEEESDSDDQEHEEDAQ